MILGQIGLGRWGLQRCWAWSEFPFKQIIAYDPNPPPRTRIPPGLCTTGSLEFLLKHADVISIAVPPANTLEIVRKIGTDTRRVFIEKPCGDTYANAMTILALLRERITIGFTPLYDQCISGPIATLPKGSISYIAQRLHHAPLHSGITVVEDLVIHDLAIIDKITPLIDPNVTVEGDSPDDVTIRLARANYLRATIVACTKSPNRVRNISLRAVDSISEDETHWTIVPGESAVCNTNGYAYPPAQARPLYRECAAFLQRPPDESEGAASRASRVWEAVKKIREAWHVR